MRARIFITQPVAQSAIDRMQALADVEWNPDAVHIMAKAELIEAVREHDVLYCLLPDRVDAEVIAANPALRMIATMKITPSDIDVAAATARRIPVTVIPPVVTEATADLHFALLLAVARRVVEGDKLGVASAALSQSALAASRCARSIGARGEFRKAMNASSASRMFRLIVC